MDTKGKVRTAVLGAAGCALAALAFPLAATGGFDEGDITIANAGKKFTPATERVSDARETMAAPVAHNVFWEWESAPTVLEHNVKQDDKLFFSGAPTDDPGGDDRFYVQASAGSYHYYCSVHGSRKGGMDGKLEMELRIGGSSATEQFVGWALDALTTGDRYDVQRRRPGKEWKNVYVDTTVTSENFDGLKPATTYKWRARSQQGGGETKRSGWSPVGTSTTDPL